MSDVLDGAQSVERVTHRDSALSGDGEFTDDVVEHEGIDEPEQSAGLGAWCGGLEAAAAAPGGACNGRRTAAGIWDRDSGWSATA
ncbi:hypothetical protein GCM10023335_55130 [Streptomyces siamensis]|uniref:Uncharacterized protein n=1 Tax=Streptomyces siamensis TaxID=1274986 RepID=A0ABP9J751_9ACTN